MNKWKLLLVLAVALCVVFGFGGLSLVRNTSAAAPSYSMDWCAIGGGGGTSTRLSSTVGQTAAGWSTGSVQLGSGFWYGTAVGATAYGTYLPFVLRTTP